VKCQVANYEYQNFAGQGLHAGGGALSSTSFHERHLVETHDWLREAPRMPLAAQWWEKIEAALARYAEPHRRYHDLGHIASLFETLAQHKQHFELDKLNWVAIELAILYHDAVYVVGDTHRRPGDNERDSAALAVNDLVDLRAPESLVTAVERAVSSTIDHVAPPHDAPVQLVLDLDLYGLSVPGLYWDSNRKIREEYAMYDDDAFCQGRAAFLRGFLERPIIYSTNHFRALCEDSARTLLQEELDLLNAGERPWLRGHRYK
jgi:predicted metal-dependent HD superfamily phosphohydrolase